MKDTEKKLQLPQIGKGFILYSVEEGIVGRRLTPGTDKHHTGTIYSCLPAIAFPEVGKGFGLKKNYSLPLFIFFELLKCCINFDIYLFGGSRMGVTRGECCRN